MTTTSLIATISGLVLFAGAAAAAGPSSIGPMAAFVEDIGGKQIVGYYVAKGSACEITMMVGDAATEMTDPGSAARVRFDLPADTSATVESAEGGRLAVTCGPDAGTLVVDAQPAGKQLASR
jgi:hypothetical protein